MKTLNTHRPPALAALLVLAAAALAHAQQGQGTQPPAADPLPPGNWTLSSGPYTEGETDSLPVVVVGVFTDAAKGLTMSRAEVRNNSEKTAEAVKFRWILYRMDDPRKILLEGETPVIGLVLPPGQKRAVEYPLASFAKLHRPLLKNGTLEGDYRLEIMVGEVLFEDATTWKWDKGQSGRRLGPSKSQDRTSAAPIRPAVSSPA